MTLLSLEALMLWLQVFEILTYTRLMKAKCTAIFTPSTRFCARTASARLLHIYVWCYHLQPLMRSAATVKKEYILHDCLHILLKCLLLFTVRQIQL